MFIESLMHSAGVKQFLMDASKLCQLHIYTHGDRRYAEHIEKIIDPGPGLFGNRIVSRTDVTDGKTHRISGVNEKRKFFKKTMNRLFPGDDSMAIGVDDNKSVWDKGSNIIEVEPYRWMDCIRGIRAKHSVEEKQIKARKCCNTPDKDIQLSAVIFILRKVREQYYKLNCSTSTDKLLTDLQRGILRACSLVILVSDPSLQNLLWERAVSMGARCTHAIDNLTTHIITDDAYLQGPHGTFCFKSGAWLLNYQWLFKSYFYWCKQPEDKAFFQLRHIGMYHPDIEAISGRQQKIVSSKLEDQSSADGMNAQHQNVDSDGDSSSISDIFDLEDDDDDDDL